MLLLFLICPVAPGFTSVLFSSVYTWIHPDTWMRETVFRSIYLFILPIIRKTETTITLLISVCLVCVRNLEVSDPVVYSVRFAAGDVQWRLTVFSFSPDSSLRWSSPRATTHMSSTWWVQQHNCKQKAPLWNNVNIWLAAPGQNTVESLLVPV